LSQQPIIIENSELAVSLAPQNATVLSIRHKQSNSSYLSDSKHSGWFRVQIPLPHWEGHAAASYDLKGGSDAVEFQTTQLLSKEGRCAISSKLILRLEGFELAFAFHPTLINTAAEQYEKRALRWTVRSRVQGNQVPTSYIFISQDYPHEDYVAHYWAQLAPASPVTDYLLREAKRLKDDYGHCGAPAKGLRGRL
jgi:hypothetical protein